MSTFSTILNALNSSGATSSTITSVFQALGGLNSVSSTVNAKLNQLAANMGNADLVKEIVLQIESTPGVPASVIPLLESLKAPGVTPLAVTQAIAAIEQAVASANTFKL